MAKELGAIYTPEGHAHILTTWAIRSKTDLILDMGVGPGVFVYQSNRQLRELGAGNDAAAKQIYGTEINKVVFDNFVEDAKNKDLEFCNLVNANFFDISYPKVDVILGNPPYVRRRGMSREDLNCFRTRTIANNPCFDEKSLSNLSDLYIYFLLYALPFLKPGGRLATIIADSWLEARYGIALKKYLMKEFELNQVISFDRSVFENAEVKSVMVLATKINISKTYFVSFARIKNGLNIKELSSFILERKIKSAKDILVKEIQSSTLMPESSWGALFKSTKLFDDITHRGNVCLIQDIADVQIGLETLAKDFFVVLPKHKDLVDKQFLQPFAYSVYDFDSPLINLDDSPLEYLFYCDEQKDNLLNTKTLNYITSGENTEVTERGSDKTVIGYQNKERIKKARRPNWYDVKSEWGKKSIAEILLPRFIYKEYKVLWNAAHYIPGGATVQFLPKEDLFANLNDIRVYLAILTSSFTEIAYRINAQVYGGGTSNIRISTIKKLPFINVSNIDNEQKSRLRDSYNEFLISGDKVGIDQEVHKTLRLTHEEICELEDLLLELRTIATVAKETAHLPD